MPRLVNEFEHPHVLLIVLRPKSRDSSQKSVGQLRHDFLHIDGEKRRVMAESLLLCVEFSFFLSGVLNAPKPDTVMCQSISVQNRVKPDTVRVRAWEVNIRRF